MNVEGWNGKRGCGRVGSSIARAVHSPEQPSSVFISVGCRLSDQSLCGALAQGSQQTLHTPNDKQEQEADCLTAYYEEQARIQEERLNREECEAFTSRQLERCGFKDP